MHFGRWDGFCAGTGLGNNVSKRQRDSCRPACLQSRGDGHRLCPDHFLPLHPTRLSPVLFINLPHHFLHLLVAGILRPARASLLLKGGWLWDGHCPSAQDRLGPPAEAWAWHLGASTEFRRERRGFSLSSSPPGWDMSPSGSRRNSMGTSLTLQLKCRGHAEGCAQGREEQR